MSGMTRRFRFPLGALQHLTIQTPFTRRHDTSISRERTGLRKRFHIRGSALKSWPEIASPWERHGSFLQFCGCQVLG